MTETRLPWPFYRAVTGGCGGEEWTAWRCGCWPYERGWDGSTSYFAHGVGEMVLTAVASVKLPRPYQSRVVYTRSWVAPDGEKFGKKQLRFMAPGHFAHLCKGYRKPYEVDATLPPVKPWEKA